jgi:5-methylcytosine-specific restriction endonuclease McrA
MADQVITRTEARAQGLKWFRTGRLCKHGHDCERYVSSGTCRECAPARRVSPQIRERAREINRLWAGRNREILRAKARERYASDPEPVKEEARRWYNENKDRYAERRSRWAAENRAEIMIRRREAYVRDREKIAERNKAWLAKNIDLVLAKNRNRRAARRGAPGKHTREDIAEIAVLQNNRCAYCRVNLGKVKRHIDHIMPICLGGSNERKNLQLLCMTCNTRKNRKHPIEFAQQMGRLL